MRRRRSSILGLRNSHRGYVMLETVIATGMLIVGLSVIGAELQDCNKAVYTMRLKTRAVMLAETQLAMLDLGLVELDSVDEIQEQDFGPRFPDWGWRLITEPTAIDGLYRLTIEILYRYREEEYREDSFDFELAETLFTTAAFRPAPKPLDLTVDLGLNEDELAEFMEKVEKAGIPGFDGGMFDSMILGRGDISIEDILKILPALEELGINLGDLEALIPPDLMQSLKESGFLEDATGGVGGEPES